MEDDRVRGVVFQNDFDTPSFPEVRRSLNFFEAHPVVLS